MPSFGTSLKTFSQLGIEPLALNSLYKFGLWIGHYQRTEKKELKDSQSISTFHSLFSLSSRDELIQTLGNNGKAALINEADEIVGGKFRMFGGEPVPLQLTFNEPLHHWTDYETGKVPVPYIVLEEYSRLPIHDIKFIWEPARFGWVFTLGRAYHITQDEKYAEAFWKYFETFNDGNPPYLGPHWMNGQEVAIRLMSLAWAAIVFQTASASSAERHEHLIRSIAHHAGRIPPTLIYARSQNNNHLITEFGRALHRGRCARPASMA